MVHISADRRGGMYAARGRPWGQCSFAGRRSVSDCTVGRGLDPAGFSLPARSWVVEKNHGRPTGRPYTRRKVQNCPGMSYLPKRTNPLRLPSASTSPGRGGFSSTARQRLPCQGSWLRRRCRLRGLLTAPYLIIVYRPFPSVHGAGACPEKPPLAQANGL